MERLSKKDILNQDTTLERLYELVDSITSSYPTTSCSTCPNNCCKNPSVTDVEFDYLKPDITIISEPTGNYCRLLSNFRCTVYQKRPLECRLYQIIDRVGRLDCPDKEIIYGDKEVAIREVLYRLLFLINGSNAEKPINEKISEMLL